MKQGQVDTASRNAPGEPAAADLYCDILPPPQARPLDYLPGLLVAGLVTLAAAHLTDRYGAPLTLMALLIGLAMNFLRAENKLTPGLGFASGTLLRISIVLLGTRVTLEEVAALGPTSLVALLIIVAATIAMGVAAARLLGVGSAFGTLAGGAAGICGASAALALAALLGERRVGQAQLALVLVAIAATSAFTMVFYPLLAHQIGLDDRQAGFLLGASIHEVAHSVGAGYSFSPRAGEVATIVKMSRVALLAPALLAVGLAFGGGVRKAGGLPWFVVSFFIVAGINSMGWIPPAVSAAAQNVATALLACAVAATGIRSPMHSLLTTGLRPLLVIIAASLAALFLSLAAVLILM